MLTMMKTNNLVENKYLFVTNSQINNLRANIAYLNAHINKDFSLFQC